MRSSPSPRTSAPAFTLVEILIVVVILGILAGIVVTLVRGKAAEARAVALEQQFQRIQQAIALYEQTHGRLPEQLSDLADAGGGDAARQPLIRLSETEDPWGNDFVYDPAAHGGYALLSRGSDGVAGGEGEAADTNR